MRHIIVAITVFMGLFIFSYFAGTPFEDFILTYSMYAVGHYIGYDTTRRDD